MPRPKETNLPSTKRERRTPLTIGNPCSGFLLAQISLSFLHPLSFVLIVLCSSRRGFPSAFDRERRGNLSGVLLRRLQRRSHPLAGIRQGCLFAADRKPRRRQQQAPVCPRKLRPCDSGGVHPGLLGRCVLPGRFVARRPAFPELLFSRHRVRRQERADQLRQQAAESAGWRRPLR